MTQNWKKLLSLLLVLTMLVGMMPAVFAAEEEPAAAPEQAEEILTEEPAEPEVPAEPETPEEPAEPAEPEEPAPVAEEEATPLTLKAADALRLEDGKVWLVLTAENGAPEALTVRIAPKPAEGEAVAEDAWTEATVAPNEAGEYLFEIAVAGLEAGDWVLEAACGEAVLTVEVSLVSDAEAEAVAVDGYTVTLPAPAEEEPVDAEEPADVVEEPGEPADEAGEPDLAGEPEDDTEFDIEIMSEAVSARKEVPVSSSLLDFGYAKYHHYGYLDPRFYITSSFFGTYPDIDGLYVIARSGGIRYYLHYYPMYDITPDCYNEPPFIDSIDHPSLPAGSYDLLMGGINGDGDLVVTQPLGAKLVVLPTPEVSLGAPFDDDRHYFNVKLPKDTTGIEGIAVTPAYNISLSFMLEHAVNGVYSLDVLNDGETYSFEYGGPDPTESDTGDLIMLSNAAWLTIPKTTAPGYLDAYFLTGDPGHPYIGENASDPLILRYKGATAQIKTDFDADVDDTRLTYKSDNTKVVTVDAVGNVTAVGNGSAVITVTSAAGGASDEVWVKVEPVTPKTFKFEKTKLTSSLTQHQLGQIKNYPAYNKYPILETRLSIDLDLSAYAGGMNIPVNWSVSGGDGLELWNPYTASAPDGGGNWVTGSFDKAPDRNGMKMKMQVKRPGVYTVTATVLGKSASCTVLVDGFTNMDTDFCPTPASQYLKAGKPVTGWIQECGSDGYRFGASVLKLPREELENAYIYYMDPSTKHPAGEGVNKVSGKYYLFQEDGLLMTYPLEAIHSVFIGDSVHPDYVFVQSDATLGAGWQISGSSCAYFDPATCFMATNTWVPVRNGKGLTWVNEYGETKDDHGNSLDNAGAAYQDGFHEINGEWYFFNGGYKKGARQTGWVYVKQDSSYNWIPADAKTGTAKIYCDPNRNGAVATSPSYGETFWAEGKEYCGHNSAYGYCIVYLPGPYTGKKDVKYLDVGDGYILGPDGSITKNALVSVYVSGSFHTMYLEANGSRAREEWITLKGKTYYFDSSGHLADTALNDTGLYVWDDVDWSQVQARPVKEGKPEDGFFYYYKGEKLKNIILYVPDGSWDHPVVILDKNGKVVTDAIASGRTTADDYPSIKTYAVDADGVVACRDYPVSGSSFFTVEVKGKLYATEPLTGEILKGGLVPIAWTWDKKVAAFGCADKNGVLARNTFKDVPDFGTVYLEEDGTVAYSEGRPLVVKNKAYLSESKLFTYPSFSGCKISVVHKPAKAGWLAAPISWTAVTVPDIVYVNKDGSLKTGLLTRPDGKKTYYTIMGGDEFKALNDFNGAPYPVIWRIGGKLYAYNSNFEPVTGWVHFSDIGISDASSEETAYIGSDVLMYFDPKTGAALAGGWKSAPLPQVYAYYGIYHEEYTLSFGAEDIAFAGAQAVNAASKTAKLYFDAKGVLTRDTELTIGGKAYLFGHDGTSAPKAGWTDANKMYYALKSGQLATGRQKIDGQYYFFDGTGSKVMNDLRKSGSKWYYYDMNGVQATPVLSTTASDGNLFGNASVQLTAVWAKDGSLSKIVYTHSGKPADGETVNFGSYDVDYDIYNSFLLDSKGLPMTGVVYGLLEDGISHARIFNADGSRVNGGNDGYSSLVQVGKTYYVMDGELVQTQSKLSAVLIDGSWDSLSDADRKTLDAYQSCYLGHDDAGDPSIWVLVNPDGSVAGSRAIGATVDGRTRLWHTDRFGIPMEYYTPLFKFGGKWYWDAAAGSTMSLDVPGEDGLLLGVVRTKSGGQLVGVYSERTGKAISGSFIVNSPGGIVMLKNGKPQTGTVVIGGSYGSYYLDDEMGLYPVNWC